MTKMEPVRFEDGRAMLLAGVRRTHSYEDAPDGIPAQWRALRELGGVPGRRGTSAYGVMCGHSAEARTLEYMAGVEVTSFHGLAPEYGRMRVPAQRYAVFAHSGHPSTVRDAWDAIIHQWLPRSGWQSAETPDFEVYGERFDPRTGEGGLEIWIGVRARHAAG
jgi:AraC family transcriptional regulator